MPPSLIMKRSFLDTIDLFPLKNWHSCNLLRSYNHLSSITYFKFKRISLHKYVTKASTVVEKMDLVRRCPRDCPTKRMLLSLLTVSLNEFDVRGKHQSEAG